MANPDKDLDVEGEQNPVWIWIKKDEKYSKFTYRSKDIPCDDEPEKFQKILMTYEWSRITLLDPKTENQIKYDISGIELWENKLPKKIIGEKVDVHLKVKDQTLLRSLAYYEFLNKDFEDEDRNLPCIQDSQFGTFTIGGRLLENAITSQNLP
jgi:hypothetical protein